MSKLRISEDLSLPRTAQTSTFVVYGGKGMGKTNLLAVFAEELARAGLRFSVLDPVGASWGLQHGATKDKPGLPVLILGGVHGDIPIEPTAGGVVADLVTDEAVSTVVDISRHPDGKMWSNGEQIRFVADYAARLYERQGEQRAPLMQIIDECGRFVPQQIPHGAPDVSRCAGAIERLVEWGRNVGVGVCLVTQRSARMNKSVSELADCMIAFRTVGPRSVDAILDWLGEHIEKARHKTLLESLRQLDVGQAIVVSPGWLKFEGIAQIRARETFDSSKTPEPGKRVAAPGKAAKPDLEKYRERMAETVEKAVANDPRELRKQLAALKAELAKTQKPAGPDKALEAENAKLRATMEKLSAQVGQFDDLVGGLLEGLANTLGPARQTLALLRKGALPTRAENAEAVPRPGPNRLPRAKGFGMPYEPSAPKPTRASAPKPESNGKLAGPEQRILDAIAWLESVGVEAPEQTAVAFLAGYTAGGGAFNNPRGRLNQTGMVEYVPGGRIKLTDAGRAAAHTPDAPLSSDELHERVLERLPGPEQRLLRPLLAAYPEAMTNEELAKAASYTAGAGAFNNPRGRLRSLGLIEYTSPGCVRARDILFLGGAHG